MDRLTKGWVYHLRKASRQANQPNAGRAVCPLCDAEVQPDLDSFKAHVRAAASTHTTLAQDADIEEAFNKVTIRPLQPCSPSTASAGRPHRKRPVPGPHDGADRQADVAHVAAVSDVPQRGNKKLCSPPSSVAHRHPSPSTSPPDGQQTCSSSDFARGLDHKNPRGRQLWTPDDDGRPSTPAMQPRSRALRFPLADHWTPSAASMIRQPETKPISQDQLVAEVKGIYAALVMIESKCIEYDNSQETTDLNHGQYHALITLHRSLLYEHHDFFLASQHPSAGEPLRRLASKYAMPARMWRHGIHSFLELLRHKLPHSLEHMLTFIYIAYSMMALLYETVPAFEDTWIECLGDLGRYRMAIEDDDIRDREVWTCVSRYWYSKASDNCPTTGRLYHHLAILARPNALQQLYYYAKALCVPIPFDSARESIMTLFDPVLGSGAAAAAVAAAASSGVRYDPVDAAFVRVNGILFSGRAMEQLQPSMELFFDGLDGRIAAAHSGWLEAGYHVSIALGCSLIGFGIVPNPLRRVLVQRNDQVDQSADDAAGGEAAMSLAEHSFNKALDFASQTWEIVLRRWGDKNTFSCIHAALVFMLHVSQRPDAMALVEGHFPWKLTAMMLNLVLSKLDDVPGMEGLEFPWPEKKAPARPLPEDYALRGLIYTQDYFPPRWFDNDRIDDDERTLEPPSKTLDRQERILWIGRRLARMDKWLTWNDATRRFWVTNTYDLDLDVDAL
ncbi:hypothetical protein CDD81_3668 [Ophiocordyceps australis]|uniref:DNA/RNA-binding domain-containing protein n=1 Tax=Ophiocordyceps australis TaxID=1399860 RepID=A0A2C5XUP7_9HYPO|nr:hypothetical protein CDD81_3668 [Ophiocordyceps australis]